MALIFLIVTSGIHVDSTWSVREFGIPKIWRSVEFGIPKIWRSVTFTIIVFDSKYFETVVSILNSFSSYIASLQSTVQPSKHVFVQIKYLHK